MGSLQAQERMRGRVVDDQTKEPLAGVTIKVLNPARTFVTDNDGYFEINLPKGDYQLSLTYLGYHTKEQQLILPFAGNLLINLLANENTLQAVNVVRTGYQALPKERATGSFEVVDKKAFDTQVSTDVISRLKSNTSLQFEERNGKTRLSLRGRSTIFANDQPLIILDEFPYEGDLNNLNPNDIESITLLKDAAAASIWGVRAGNGVIVITTKRAIKKSPLKIEANINYSRSDVPNLLEDRGIATNDFITAEKLWYELGLYNPDLANTTNQAPISPVVNALHQKAKGLITQNQQESILSELAKNEVRNDISKYLYQPKQLQQYYLGLSESFENLQYRLGVGYDYSKQSLKGNDFGRVYLSAKGNINLSKKLSLDLNAQFIQTKTTIENLIGNISVGGSAIKAIYPYTRFVDDQGTPVAITRDYRDEYKMSMQANGLLDWTLNPIKELEYTDNTRSQNEIRLNSALKYSIVPALSAEVRYQFETQIAKGRTLNNENTYFTRNLINRYSKITNGIVERAIPMGGILSQSFENLLRQSVRAQLNFDKSIALHRINFIAGAEAREILLNGDNNRYYGYSDVLGSTIPVNYNTAVALLPLGTNFIPNSDNISKVTERYRSFYLNGSYTYDSKYILSASSRIDQSNFFGVAANKRSIPLWSTGFKWLVDQAEFFKSSAITQLSLRLSYGFNGNLDRTVTALTTANETTSTTTRQPAANIVSPPNPDLSWEKMGILNIGVDFSLKDNWLSGSLEYFHKNGTNLIGLANLDPTTGLSSYRGNVAGIKTTGLDINLTARTTGKKFVWASTLFININKDRVTSYSTKPLLANYLADGSFSGSTDLYAPTVGRPLFGVYSRKWGGLNPINGNPMGFVNGQLSENYAALLSPLGKEVDSLVYHGRATPPVYGAIRNSFSYKGVNLSFNIGYQFKYFFRRNSINYSQLFNRGIGHEDFAKRWIKPGDETTTIVPSFTPIINANRDSFYASSAILVERADNIRLQDITIDYDLPLLQKHYVKKVNIYFYARNMGILWRANQNKIDPDYPMPVLPKTYSIGLKIYL